MTETLKALLGSKKFVTACIGVLVALAAKVNWHLQVSEVMAVVSPLIAAVLGQGIADAGKERAKVEKAGPVPPV